MGVEGDGALVVTGMNQYKIHQFVPETGNNNDA